MFPFEVHVVLLDCLDLEEETDVLSRNVCLIQWLYPRDGTGKLSPKRREEATKLRRSTSEKNEKNDFFFRLELLAIKN